MINFSAIRFDFWLYLVYIPEDPFNLSINYKNAQIIQINFYGHNHKIINLVPLVMFKRLK